LYSVSKLDWEHDFRLKTILQTEVAPVFLVLDVHHALSCIDISTHDVITFILTEYPPDHTVQSVMLPQISLDQLRAVHHVIHGWDLDYPVLLVTENNATTLKGPHLTDWIDAGFAQLDKHHSYVMYDLSLSRSAVPPSAKIVGPIWNYSQKGDGTFNAQTCTNGKQLVRLGLTFKNMYAACMEQHCLYLFVALSACFFIVDGDVINAYAHAAIEGPNIFLIVYYVFQVWCTARLSVDLSLGSCVPLLKAM
jgi:hypothetical protein